jgi:hypothetical protein
MPRGSCGDPRAENQSSQNHLASNAGRWRQIWSSPLARFRYSLSVTGFRLHTNGRFTPQVAFLRNQALNDHRRPFHNPSFGEFRLERPSPLFNLKQTFYAPAACALCAQTGIRCFTPCIPHHALAGAASGDVGELYLPCLPRWSVGEAAYSGGRSSLLIQPTALLDFIGSIASAL